MPFNKTLRLPKILTQQRDFAEIDKFMRAIARDAVLETKDGDTWRVIQTTLNKESYCVLTALDGWCDFFAELAATMNEASYNDKPLRSLISKMRLDQPSSAALFNQAKAVVDAQRKLYMLAPDNMISGVAIGALKKAA